MLRLALPLALVCLAYGGLPDSVRLAAETAELREELEQLRTEQNHLKTQFTSFSATQAQANDAHDWADYGFCVLAHGPCAPTFVRHRGKIAVAPDFYEDFYVHGEQFGDSSVKLDKYAGTVSLELNLCCRAPPA